jgi:hypothetical protein
VRDCSLRGDAGIAINWVPSELVTELAEKADRLLDNCRGRGDAKCLWDIRWTKE